MYGRFEYITDLQYRVKNLRFQVDEFRSGRKYVKMREGFEAELAGKDRRIRRLERELADVRRQASKERNFWIQAADDTERACAKMIRKMEHRLKDMEERALRAERQRDELYDRLKGKNKEFYRVATELEEEKGRNKKLAAQLNRDFENSSLPSSMKPGRKKITNNREKTDRKPGGQPGHEGRGRKKQTPTRVISIPAPEEYTNDPDLRPTGRMITKQVIGLGVTLAVDEYVTEEFRKASTGQRVHAQFPPGVVNDVNCDGSVKAFVFLLNNHCFVSIDKTRDFLSDLTDGALSLSKGMISGLSREFAEKTRAEQEKAFSDLLLSPVMNTDATSAKAGGQNAHVYVCATPATAMYFAREHKGHEGVKGTPVEDHQGILVHDHDKTFCHYGSDRQECSGHGLRYLQDSMDNEPGLKWNTRMRELLREMIHCRNSLGADDDLDPGKAAGLETRYTEILNVAKEEYEYEPPSAYCKEGYNLFKRLDEYMKNHLLSLHDKRVPADNDLSERLLRNYKRKQKQAMTFRSFESLEYLCSCMGVLASLSSQNENPYKNVAAKFDCSMTAFSSDELNDGTAFRAGV
jgi:hypothetical protein